MPKPNLINEPVLIILHVQKADSLKTKTANYQLSLFISYVELKPNMTSFVCWLLVIILHCKELHLDANLVGTLTLHS